ncbi:uncharacterized protein LOC126672289 [Mercurialis annua]|uniref:uncharacterized protein LOC126672289 n=1 Tax=Mercurialis annua TaxID=3986 RepID=UPI0021608395|nr:uncharacterized protein LOC126672289 [Mercurialis annua]
MADPFGRSEDQPSSPYYLHPSENPSLLLVTNVLTDQNYHSWCKAMKKALILKNKLKFVDGSIAIPNRNDASFPPLERCNTMEEIYSYKQNNLTVTDYYTHLKMLWDELSSLRPIPNCVCNPTCSCVLIRTIKEYFSNAKIQIMMKDPLPPTNKVFSMIVQHERQLGLNTSNQNVDSQAFLSRGNKYNCENDSQYESSACYSRGNQNFGNGNYSGDAANENYNRQENHSRNEQSEGNNGGHFPFTKDQYSKLLSLIQQSGNSAQVNQISAHFKQEEPDTGATDHFTCKPDLFKNSRSIKNMVVKLPNGHRDLTLSKNIGSAKKKEGLYELQLSNNFSCNSCSTKTMSSAYLWHLRMGHPSTQRLKKLHSMDSGITFSNKYVCEICHFNKQKKLTFPVSESSTKCNFELVHMDIWGPTQTPTVNGYRYFLTIVYDCSKYTWVFLMHNKSQTRDFMYNFFSYVETQFSTKIKTVRTNNGVEFNMVDFFNSKGTIHQKSCTYTPEQNSVVERKQQHILNIARSLKYQLGLNISL